MTPHSTETHNNDKSIPDPLKAPLEEKSITRKKLVFQLRREFSRERRHLLTENSHENSLRFCGRHVDFETVTILYFCVDKEQIKST